MQRDAAGRQGLVALAGLALAAVVAWAALRATAPPAPPPAEVPASSFSADRAMRHVERLARSPRRLGTAEHRAAREYVVSRLTALGFEVAVQTGRVVRPAGQDAWLATGLANVVATLGSGSPEILLVSHYDSQPQTWGAGDAASGVAVIIEAARALTAGESPGGTLRVVITDGEESGLMGARLYTDSRRGGEPPDLVLNFEARGNRGPVPMFETSTGNWSLAALLARTVAAPFANSMSYEIYRRMPNDTDFSVFKGAGWRGLNFAFIGNHPAYHSYLDTPSALSRATVQQEGDAALALVRTLLGTRSAPGSVPSPSADGVYFNPWDHQLLVVPLNWARLLALGLALAALYLAWRLAVDSVEGWAGVARAIAGLVGAVVAATLVGVGASWALATFGGELVRTPHGVPYPQSWLVLALALVAGATLLAIVGRTGARGQGSALAAVLSFWGVASVALAASAPGVVYLAAWPLVFLTPAAWWVTLPAGRSAVGWIAAVAALPAVALWAPVLDLAAQALTVRAGGALAGVSALIWSFVLPALVAVAARWRRAAVALVAAGLAVGVGTVALDRATADTPRVDTLFWVETEGEDKGLWCSADARVDDWTVSVLGAAPAVTVAPAWLGGEAGLLTAPAAAAGLRAPTVEVLRDQRSADGRRLEIVMRSRRGATVLRGHAEASGLLLQARLDGERLGETGAGERRALRWTVRGVPDEGVVLELWVDGDGPVILEVADQKYGLDVPRPPGPRPPGLMARPSWWTDSTFAVRKLRL